MARLDGIETEVFVPPGTQGGFFDTELLQRGGEAESLMVTEQSVL